MFALGINSKDERIYKKCPYGLRTYSDSEYRTSCVEYREPSLAKMFYDDMTFRDLSDLLE
jgi:hypothetical protein